MLTCRVRLGDDMFNRFDGTQAACVERMNAAPQRIYRVISAWQLGLVVARWSRSTTLLYAGPG